MKGYPKPFIRLMLLAFLLLLGSGLALLPNLLVFKWDMDLDFTFEGATRMKIAAAHVSAAMVVIWFFGALWPVHMRSGMRRQKNRASGLGMVTLILTLAATGVASFYLGDESWQKGNSAIHLASGALLLLAGVLHRIIGRRISAKSHSSSHH
jgi:cation transport ATPase